jgi:SOS-response transcriptional repressor LexA
MTMDSAVPRVFLSHTSELRDFPRDESFVRAAENAVIRANATISDMSYFTARDGKPADYCRQEVGKCDVYAGIIGFRYGSPVSDDQQWSYVELEFDTATDLGLPRLLFLLDPDEVLALPSSYLSDPDDERNKRQRKFREKLKKAGATIAFVDSPQRLETKLYQALTEGRASLFRGKSAEQSSATSLDDSMFTLAGRAQQGWQDARGVLRRVASAMDRLERRGAAPPGINDWDYADQQAVHHRLAASMAEPVAEMEAQSERAARLVTEATADVQQLRSAGYAQLPGRLAPMIESVSEFAQMSDGLLDRMTGALDNMHARAAADYHSLSEAVSRARAHVEEANRDAATVLRSLRQLQPGTPAAAPVARIARSRAADPVPDRAALSNLNWATRAEASDVVLGGKAAAGVGTMPSGVDAGSLWVPERYARDTTVFTVRVEGDSMTGDGLRDGDYVIVDPGKDERDGDIVVVVIGHHDDERAVVKRMFHEGTAIRLESSNPDYPPATLGPDDHPRVAGKVTGVFRPVDKLP